MLTMDFITKKIVPPDIQLDPHEAKEVEITNNQVKKKEKEETSIESVDELSMEVVEETLKGS